MWCVVVFLVAFAGSSAFADDLTFPEVARGNARIVSGWEATEGQLPYQLAMRAVSINGGVNACGASIIHNEWGLTAAHCTARRHSLVLLAGSVNLTRPFYMFETREFYNHPLFNSNAPTTVQPNDVSIIKFNRWLEFNELVQPIRIQRSIDRNYNYNRVRMTASGWGRTWTNGDSPENLRWVFLRGVTNLNCRLAFRSNIVQSSTVCARGYNLTSQSTCQGDSGGPLTVIDRDGKPTLVGITSFVSGQGCHVDMPAGFCRGGYYHSWYKEVTGIDFDWDWVSF